MSEISKSPNYSQHKLVIMKNVSGKIHSTIYILWFIDIMNSLSSLLLKKIFEQVIQMLSYCNNFLAIVQCRAISKFYISIDMSMNFQFNMDVGN